MNRDQRLKWRLHVFGRDDLTPAQKLVLLALETFADYPAGTNARPGVAKLAAMCGLKQRAVEYALARGRECGLIEQTSRANPKGHLAAVHRLLPTPVTTRTSVHVEDVSTRTAVHVEPVLNPHQTPVQPAPNGTSTRMSVQPTNPRTPIQDTKENLSCAQARTPTSAKRRTQIRDDYMPSQQVIATIRDEQPSISSRQLEHEHRKFIDHWKQTGKPMADWDAAWRNWMRRAAERGDFRRAPNGTPVSTADQRVAQIQAMKAAEQASRLELEYGAR